MSDEYKRVLNQWAKELVEKRSHGADVEEILEVEFTDYEATGYCDTCWSPAYTAVNITYKDGIGETKYFYDTSDDDEGFPIGTLLQELFAIAEKEE